MKALHISGIPEGCRTVPGARNYNKICHADINFDFAKCQGNSGGMRNCKLGCAFVLREKFSLPIIGVVDATAKAAAAVTVNKKVGILGTSGTIASGAYERKLKELDEKIETVPRECPLFVPLVENGHINCIETYHIACNYLQPLKDKEVDTIILGCTHYPLLKEVIADIMGSDTKLVDSAAPTCGHVSRLLDEKICARAAGMPSIGIL